MDQVELLRRLVASLERLRLPYFVTGSTATIFYGEPRFTIDIDVVVDLAIEDLGRLLAEFPADDFYVSEEAARRAVRTRGQFNVIHPRSGLKIDLIVAAMTDFDRSRFERRRRIHPAADYEADFASPEDVILRKLQAYREGGSEKHLRDVAGVLAISGSVIDHEYIEAWADRLGVSPIWRRVLASRPAGS